MTTRPTHSLRLLFAFLICVLPPSACQVSSGAGVSAGPWAPMAQAGPETWTVDGTPYRIASTYYLALPEGLQYTIDYEAPSTLDLARMTEARAFEAVAPLMRHAASTKLYAREVIRDASGKAVPVKMIGVSIFSQSGILTSGYRVSRRLEQLQTPTVTKNEPWGR